MSVHKYDIFKVHTRHEKRNKSANGECDPEHNQGIQYQNSQTIEPKNEYYDVDLYIYSSQFQYYQICLT